MELIDAKRRNILLVHGGFADGSIWMPVIEILQRERVNVVASQLPLTSFPHDVDTVVRDLATFQGPTVMVGHSYGGLVITEAAAGKPNVSDLVYIAGGALDSGESIADIFAEYPSPAIPFIVPIDPKETPPFLIVQRDKIPQFFCPDIDPGKARAVAAIEKPTSATLLTAKINTPAWRKFPTWCQIFNKDQIFLPDAQRMLAERATPPDRISSIDASHAGLLSRPEEVARFILRAALTP